MDGVARITRRGHGADPQARTELFLDADRGAGAVRLMGRLPAVLLASHRSDCRDQW